MLSKDVLEVGLDTLGKSYESLCKAAHFISRLLDCAGSFLPVYPLGDQFDYLNKPFVTEDKIYELKSTWQSFQEKEHEWAELNDVDYWLKLLKT